VYTWLGFLWIQVVPLGDAAYRMNLMSAVMAAAAVSGMFLLVRALGPGQLAAGTAALLLGASDTFWSQAVITEVYTTNVALQVATLLVLLRWAGRVRMGLDGDRLLLGFALLFGTSLGTHLSNLGFAPVYVAFVVAVDPKILHRPRLLAAALASFGIGAAQYAWLFVRGSAFDQFPNPEPDTWAGFWDYTFGAFSSKRFAYPLAGAPFRLVFYLRQLAQSFTTAGVALGALGAWIVLARSPLAFWLLFGVHATNVFLFAQFAAPDVQVFFLPGYVAWAAFVAWGIQGLFDGARRLRTRFGPGSHGIDRAVHALSAVGLAWTLLALGHRTYQSQDRSHDTFAPDFDRNVYDLLPSSSVVLARRGVFGAHMLYWQAAEGVRPDVTILGQRSAPSWDGRTRLFTTLRVAAGVPHRGSVDRRDLADAWYVPQLFGNSRRLILSRVELGPPALQASPPPSVSPINRRVGGVTLLAATVTPELQAPSPRLHVESWWRVPDARHVVVSTRLDEHTLESHLLGLDNLARYAEAVELPPDAVVHEDFRVVVPSTIAGGTHVVRLGVTIVRDYHLLLERIDVGTVAFR
jgi:hypothetical protein